MYNAKVELIKFYVESGEIFSGVTASLGVYRFEHQVSHN